MKKIKIYILFVLLVAACDKKAEYGKFDEDADFAYGICLDYKRDNAGYYIFQYKRQLKQRNCDIIRKKLVEKSNNERYKNYSYTLKKLKFDFKSDKYSLISYIDYDVYYLCYGSLFFHFSCLFEIHYTSSFRFKQRKNCGNFLKKEFFLVKKSKNEKKTVDNNRIMEYYISHSRGWWNW